MLVSIQITELRFPVSGASRESFRQSVHNTNGWAEIFGKILASPSTVWGRNKPETQVWALIRADRVRNDYRLLFRFVNAATGEDLHLGRMIIEHGGSQIVTPMTYASMPTIIAAKDMYGVRGETRMHHGFAVNGLRGIFPQALNLVVGLELPRGITSPVIGVPEVMERTDESEFGHFRGNGHHRFEEERYFPRRGQFPQDRDIDWPRPVYRG